MRLVAGLLALTLTASLASADDANPPAPLEVPARVGVGLRVVKVMPESHQALLYDRHRGTHVLAEVGDALGDFRVMAIEDDEVLLAGEGKEVVLAAPEARWRRRGEAPAAPTERDLPEDPYAEPAVPSVQAPADPYAEEAAVRSVRAPAPAAAIVTDDPYADPSPTTPLAGPLPAVPPVTEAPPVTGAPPVTRTPAKPVRTGARGEDFASALLGGAAGNRTQVDEVGDGPPSGRTVIAKADLDAALADFGVLTRGVRGAFTEAGARVDHVAPGSVFARGGLRPGDIVTAVDGRPLRSIDDAADLYVRAPSLTATRIDVLRGGTPLKLDVEIR